MEQELITACGEGYVMVMGMSFIIGSLTTVFILVLLDLYRTYRERPEDEDDLQD